MSRRHTKRTLPLPIPMAPAVDDVPLIPITPVARRVGNVLIVIRRAGQHPTRGLVVDAEAWGFDDDVAAEFALRNLEQHGGASLGGDVRLVPGPGYEEAEVAPPPLAVSLEGGAS